MTRCPRHCHMLQDKSTFIQEMEEEEYNNQYYVHETTRTLEAQQESQKPKEKTPEELIPEEYHKFLNVFSKKESERMLIKKPWNHAILWLCQYRANWRVLENYNTITKITHL